MKKHFILYTLPTWLIVLLLPFLAGCNEEMVYHDVATDMPSLTIERADNQEHDRITVRFIPNEPTASFCYALGKEADRAEFENGSFPGIRIQQGNAPLEFTFANLQPSTTYVAYARAYDASDKPSSLSSMKMKTYTDEISITPDFVGVRSAAFRVNLSDDYYKYVYAFGKPTDKEAFINGTLDGMTEIVERKSFSFNNFNLQPTTRYSFFLLAYNRIENPTKVFEVPFETLSAELSPTVLSFSENSPNMLYRTVTINVSDQCSKAAVMISETGTYDPYLQGYSSWNGRLKEMMTSWASNKVGFINAIFNTSSFSLTEQTKQLFLTDPNPFDKPYEAFILLYDKDGDPLAVERYPFQSPPFDSSAPKAQVRIDKIEVEPESATYHISWDENTIAFMWKSFEMDYLNSLTEEQVYEMLSKQVYEAKNSDIRIHEATLSTNFPAFDYTGKTICLIVAGINKNGLINGLTPYVKSSYVAGKTE